MSNKHRWARSWQATGGPLSSLQLLRSHDNDRCMEQTSSPPAADHPAADADSTQSCSAASSHSSMSSSLSPATVPASEPRGLPLPIIRQSPSKKARQSGVPLHTVNPSSRKNAAKSYVQQSRERLTHTRDQLCQNPTKSPGCVRSSRANHHSKGRKNVESPSSADDPNQDKAGSERSGRGEEQEARLLLDLASSSFRYRACLKRMKRIIQVWRRKTVSHHSQDYSPTLHAYTSSLVHERDGMEQCTETLTPPGGQVDYSKLLDEEGADIVDADRSLLLQRFANHRARRARAAALKTSTASHRNFLLRTAFDSLRYICASPLERGMASYSEMDHVDLAGSWKFGGSEETEEPHKIADGHDRPIRSNATAGRPATMETDNTTTTGKWQPFRSSRRSSQDVSIKSPVSEVASVVAEKTWASPGEGEDQVLNPSDETVLFWARDEHFAATPPAGLEERRASVGNHRSDEDDVLSERDLQANSNIGEKYGQREKTERQVEVSLDECSKVLRILREQQNESKVMAGRYLLKVRGMVFTAWSECSRCSTRIIQQLISLQHLNPVLALLSHDKLKQLGRGSHSRQMRDGENIFLRPEGGELGEEGFCIVLEGVCNASVRASSSETDRNSIRSSVCSSGDGHLPSASRVGAKGRNTKPSAPNSALLVKRLSVGDSCGGLSKMSKMNLLGVRCCASISLRWHAEAEVLRAIMPRHSSSSATNPDDLPEHSACCSEVLIVGHRVFDEILVPALRQQIDGLSRLLCKSIPVLSGLRQDDVHSCLHESTIFRSINGGEMMVQEGSKAGLGLYLLVTGGVDLITFDALTTQRVELCKLRDQGHVFSAVSSAKWPFSAHSSGDGVTTLFIPQQVMLKTLRLANKAAAHAAMEQFGLQRLENVREAYAKRTAAVHRLSDRLQLLRTHIALLVDLSNVLSRPDVRSLASMRDVSRLLGPVQRMKAALDTAILTTTKALLPAPSASESAVLTSWLEVLQAVGACCSNLLPALQALSCLRLVPSVLAAISASQKACASGLSLVDVLPKPVSFCSPLVRSIQALHSILHQPPALCLMVLHTSGPSAQESERITSDLTQAPDACNQNLTCDLCHERDPNNSSSSHWDERIVHGTMAYAKDVAAAVERSRVLAKSMHCSVEAWFPGQMPSTIVKEHRALVKTAEVWRVLTTDVNIKFFLTDKAGSAAGILDEAPVTVSLFNDSILVTHNVNPAQIDARRNTSSNVLYLLGARATPIVCAHEPAASDALSMSPGTSTPSPAKRHRRRSSSMREGCERTVGFCIALEDGAGRMLLMRMRDRDERDVWLHDLCRCIELANRRFSDPYVESGDLEEDCNHSICSKLGR